MASLHLTSKEHFLIPKGLLSIGLHKGSPKSDWDLLREHLRYPQYKTPEGNPLVAIDYETYEVDNVYKRQYMEDAMPIWERKVEEFKRGERKTRPTKPSKDKSLPFDIPNTLVAGLSICTQESTSFYLNFGHLEDDGLGHIIPHNREAYDSTLDWKKKLRWQQGDFLTDLFSEVPDRTEFIAHNASFEYRVSFMQGWDFFWKDATRYEGHMHDSMHLAKLFNSRLVGLKGLVSDYFDFDQPRYHEAICYTHLLPWLCGELAKLKIDRPKAKAIVLIKNIKGKSKLEFKKADVNRVLAQSECNSNQIRLEWNKKLKHVKENFFTMDTNTLTQVTPYAAQDAYWTLRLFKKLMDDSQEKINSPYCATTWDYYRKIDYPILKLVPEMVHTGVKVNEQKILDLRSRCDILIDKKRIELRAQVITDLKLRFPKIINASWEDKKIKDKVRYYVNSEAEQLWRKRRENIHFNPAIHTVSNSWSELVEYINKIDVLNPDNMKQVFFDLLCLPVLRLTDKGGFSLSKKVLAIYEAFCKSASVLIDLNRVKQTQSLYAYPYLRLIHPETGRVHGELKQSGAETGRFTMANPNLQQVPKTELREVDKLLGVRKVIERDGSEFILLSPDFSQIELRLAAHLSQDKKMMQCYNGDEHGNFVDIHTMTNLNLFGRFFKNIEDPKERMKMQKQYRKVSKPVNFLTQYGGGPVTLLSNLRALGIEDFNETDCKHMIKDWFNLYRGVAEYNSAYGERICPGRGYGETIFGRKRYVDGFSSYERGIVMAAQRKVCNHSNQGSASGIMKITMARLYWHDLFRKLGAVILLSVHDELTIQVPIKNFKKVLPIVVAAFTDYNLTVPLRTSLDAGVSFGELCGPEPLDSGDIQWSEIDSWINKDLELVGVEEYEKGYEPESTIEFGDREWLF